MEGAFVGPVNDPVGTQKLHETVIQKIGAVVGTEIV